MTPASKSLVKVYPNEISASVEMIAGKDSQLLEIGENGILDIPEGVIPEAFRLILHAPEQTIFAQKNVGEDRGKYRHIFDELNIVEREVFSPPIQISRPTKNTCYTLWHAKAPNRMDCWTLDRIGHLELFQIGIITHDNGETFKLLGEVRWQGRVFYSAKLGLLARPDEPKWGSLLWNKGESREAIRRHPEFQALVRNARLHDWTGSDEELYPPLGEIPEGKYVRIDWYIPFAGMTGQGIAKDRNGKSYWLHGQDLGIAPDADGVKRLYHGDLISYLAIHEKWGSKKDGPAKLIGVKLVERPALAPA